MTHAVALGVAIVAGLAMADTPVLTVERSATNSGSASHLLERPIGHVSFVVATPHEAIGRVAWLLGARVVVDAAARATLAGRGDLRLDVRGGDGAGLLRAASGLSVTADGDRIVLHVAGESPDAGTLREVAAEPVTLPEGVLVRGRVLTPEGRPLPGACVAAPGRPPVRTGADGRFACRVSARGEAVTAWFAGRSPSAPTSASGGGVELRIGAATARIVVRAQPGVGDLLVVCDPPPASSGLRGAAAGPVVIDVAGSGRRALRIAARGCGAVTCDVDVRAGDTTSVRAALPTASLADRMRDETISFAASDVRLTAALWDLMQRSALPIRFESGLGGAGTHCVSFASREASLEEIVAALCDDAGATWRLDEAAWLVRIAGAGATPGR